MSVQLSAAVQTGVKKLFFSFLVLLLVVSLVSPSLAQEVDLKLPSPSKIKPISKPFAPAIIRAVTINPKDPFLFDFIVDKGDTNFEPEAFEAETQKLVKYFLAALTIPERDLWVNLSPYEQDSMVPQVLGVTELGKDLLVEDYYLKQVTAQLTNPNTETGKKFWTLAYAKAQELYGTTQVPINTFSKVWIVPDQAVVLEKDGSAFIADSHLKVFLDQDYLAIKKNLDNKEIGTDKIGNDKAQDINGFSSALIKEVVLPEIEKEVNVGENFAMVRQIYSSAILAAWYKKRLKESLLGKLYADQNKVAGVNASDMDSGDKIFEKYTAALKTGAYNIVKKDYDLSSQKIVQRKYFSGGVRLATNNTYVPMSTTQDLNLTPAANTAVVNFAAGVSQYVQSPVGVGTEPQSHIQVVSVRLGNVAPGIAQEVNARVDQPPRLGGDVAANIAAALTGNGIGSRASSGIMQDILSVGSRAVAFTVVAPDAELREVISSTNNELSPGEVSSVAEAMKRIASKAPNAFSNSSELYSQLAKEVPPSVAIKVAGEIVKKFAGAFDKYGNPSKGTSAEEKQQAARTTVIASRLYLAFQASSLSQQSKLSDLGSITPQRIEDWLKGAGDISVKPSELAKKAPQLKRLLEIPNVAKEWSGSSTRASSALDLAFISAQVKNSQRIGDVEVDGGAVTSQLYDNLMRRLPDNVKTGVKKIAVVDRADIVSMFHEDEGKLVISQNVLDGLGTGEFKEGEKLAVHLVSREDVVNFRNSQPASNRMVVEGLKAAPDILANKLNTTAPEIPLIAAIQQSSGRITLLEVRALATPEQNTALDAVISDLSARGKAEVMVTALERSIGKEVSDRPSVVKQAMGIVKEPAIINDLSRLHDVAPAFAEKSSDTGFKAQIQKIANLSTQESEPEKLAMRQVILDSNPDVSRLADSLMKRGLSSPDQARQLAGALLQIRQIYQNASDFEKSAIAEMPIGEFQKLLVEKTNIPREVAVQYTRNIENQVGGIDLSAERMDLQIKRDGNGVVLPIADQDLKNLKIDGLSPVILDVQPATPLSVPFLMNLANTAQTK